ncbi:MAG: DMT family transporter [Chitinophagales bacterium]
MKAWIFIFIAVILQSLWGMVLKILDFGKAWHYIQKGHVFQFKFLLHIWPVLAYLVLGLLTAIALSKAYKLLPLSVVYASWMGLTLVLQVFIDLFIFKENMPALKYLFILCILIGILGLKLSNPNQKAKNSK